MCPWLCRSTWTLLSELSRCMRVCMSVRCVSVCHIHVRFCSSNDIVLFIRGTNVDVFSCFDAQVKPCRRYVDDLCDDQKSFRFYVRAMIIPNVCLLCLCGLTRYNWRLWIFSRCFCHNRARFLSSQVMWVACTKRSLCTHCSSILQTDWLTNQPFILQRQLYCHIEIWSRYAGRWLVGCYVWYSEEGTGQPQPAQSPPRCIKCNRPPINGQRTNHCVCCRL